MLQINIRICEFYEFSKHTICRFGYFIRRFGLSLYYTKLQKKAQEEINDNNSSLRI